jgi:phosphohistidine phosphatase SixA
MEKKFPTSAVAVVDFDVGAWHEIDTHEGALSDFLTPAALKTA